MGKRGGGMRMLQVRSMRRGVCSKSGGSQSPSQTGKHTCLTKKVAGKAVRAAQEAERKKFGDMLEKEDRRGNVFKVVKRMVKRNRDVDGGGYIKDCNGDIVVEQEKLLNVWREYFDKLLNEEFEWNRGGLVPREAVVGPE